MKRNDLLVSVVTVCFNSAATIEKAISSVINQSYGNIEYIVIDGDSTDGTLDIINNYRNNISIVVSGPDKGIYYAMNKGIDLASGEIITFLNSDDYFFVDTVKKAAACYIETNSDVVYGVITAVYSDGSTRLRKCDSVELNDFYYGFPIPHPGTFVKTELMRKYRFDTDYRIAADYDLFLGCI